MSYDAYDDVWEWYSTYTGQDFPEKAAADSIFIYVSPFLLLIGTIGNILSVIVLKKLSHKVSNVFYTYFLYEKLKICLNKWQQKGSHALLNGNSWRIIKKCNYHATWSPFRKFGYVILLAR